MLERSYFVRRAAPDGNRELVREPGSVAGIEGVSLFGLEETAEA